MKKTPYLPSTGDEGIWFDDNWCDKCSKNPINPGAKKQCRHLLAALGGDHNGVWVTVNGKPECTAFKSRKEANKRRRTKRLLKKQNERARGIHSWLFGEY